MVPVRFLYIRLVLEHTDVLNRCGLRAKEAQDVATGRWGGREDVEEGGLAWVDTHLPQHGLERLTVAVVEGLAIVLVGQALAYD